MSIPKDAAADDHNSSYDAESVSSDTSASTVVVAADKPLTRWVGHSDDIGAVRRWLYARGSNSQNTFDRYERAVRRFLVFLADRGETLNTATFATIQDYEHALLTGHDGRRPSSPRATDATFRVLSSMFSLLAAEGYLERNVLVLRRPRSKPNSNTRNDRFLSNAQLEALMAEAAALSQITEPLLEVRRAHRTRFLLTWFLSMGSRITETLNSRMADIYAAPERDQMRWTWRLNRKGNRPGDIPVRQDAMAALRGYRAHLGLPPDPDERETGYLVYTLYRTSTGPLWRGTISEELKSFFIRASERVEAPRLRKHMRQATTHWLRHTAATQLLDHGAEMRFVAKLLGHASESVTSSIYDHAEREIWREQMNKGRSFAHESWDASESQ